MKNSILTAPDTLTSLNGRFVLSVQHDGNLVMYADGNAVWATGTSAVGTPPHSLMLQVISLRIVLYVAIPNYPSLSRRTATSYTMTRPTP